jgi:hypothetical protein
VKIAILGWGSLLWDSRPEFDDQHDPWALDGPTLKIEFSRVSESRAGTLTLVVDEANGSLVTVAWCVSKRSTILDAVEDLRLREGTTATNVGRVVVAEERTKGLDATATSIFAWAGSKGLDAVIWTALESNFEEQTGCVFGVEAALAHVAGLEPNAGGKALEYVQRAPDFVRTPVREALSKRRP